MRARIVTDLVAVGPRSACSDAERRAARLLARELREQGRRSRTETVWVRPQWPVIWLLHALLGVAGSVVSVDAPAVGLGILVAATVSALVELSGRATLLGLLLPRRATQNVVSPSPDRGVVRVLVTTAYDAPRAPTAFVAMLARADRALARATRDWWPHPLGLLALALPALAAAAGARLAEVEGVALGAAQLVPTVVCILAVAVLADLTFARTDPGAAHAGAAAVALALVAALDERPPRRLAVDLVLAGAGEGPALGMRAYLRSRRRTTDRSAVAVVHLEPCATGTPTAYARGGPLLALSFHPQLVRLAEARGTNRRPSGALSARRARWPAIALGCRDQRPGIDPAALSGALQAARTLVERLDAELAGRTS